MKYNKVEGSVMSPMRNTSAARSIPYDLGQYLVFVGKTDYIITLNPFDPLEDYHYIKEGEYSSQAELEYILSEFE